jgi:hypothetical protein
LVLQPGKDLWTGGVFGTGAGTKQRCQDTGEHGLQKPSALRASFRAMKRKHVTQTSGSTQTMPEDGSGGLKHP